MVAGIIGGFVERTVGGANAFLTAGARARREPERAGFLLVSEVHLWSKAFGWRRVSRATKPLLMPLLVGSALRSERSCAERAIACAGLTAATAGDVLLLSDDPRALPRGALAFAGNQLAWSALLWRRGARASISRAVPRVVPWALAVGLAARTKPQLLPVVAGYGGLLAATSMLADDPRLRGREGPAQGLGHGGNLFLVSDALILLRTIGLGRDSVAGRVTDAGVMVTYLIAQLLIVDGLMRGR